MFKILNNRFLYFIRPGVTLFPTPEYNKRTLIPLSKVSRIVIESHQINVCVGEVANITFDGSSKEETEAKFYELAAAMNGGNPVCFEEFKVDPLADAALAAEDQAPPYPPYTEYEELLPPNPGTYPSSNESEEKMLAKPQVKDMSLYKSSPDAWVSSQLR